MLARTALKFVERSVKTGTGSIPLRSTRRTGHLGLGTVGLGGGVAFRPEDAEYASAHAEATSSQEDVEHTVTSEQGETIFDGEEDGGDMEMEVIKEGSAGGGAIGRGKASNFDIASGLPKTLHSSDSDRTSGRLRSTEAVLSSSTLQEPTGSHRAVMGKLPVSSAATNGASSLSSKRGTSSQSFTATTNTSNGSGSPPLTTSSTGNVPSTGLESKSSMALEAGAVTLSANPGDHNPTSSTTSGTHSPVGVAASYFSASPGSPISSSATSAGQGGAASTGGGSGGGAKSVEAYRFLLHHIDAEIAALKRRHTSVSNHRVQLEDQQATRIRELYNFMESPWLMLRTTLSPPLPDTGVAVYLKEQMLQKRGGGGAGPLDLARDKMFVLACQKNYRSLSLKDKQPYEEAARYNSILRQEMKRRLSSGCARFEVFCDQVQECTAVMVRDGGMPPFPPGTVLPSPSVPPATLPTPSGVPNPRGPFLSPSRRGTISRGMPRLAAAALPGPQQGGGLLGSPGLTPPSVGTAGDSGRKGARVMSRGKVRVQHRSQSGVGVATPMASTSGRPVRAMLQPSTIAPQVHSKPSTKSTVLQKERSSLMRVRHSARRTLKLAAAAASKKTSNSDVLPVGKAVSSAKSSRSSEKRRTGKKNSLQKKRTSKVKETPKVKKPRNVSSGLNPNPATTKKPGIVPSRRTPETGKKSTKTKITAPSLPLSTVVHHVSQKLTRPLPKSRRTPNSGSVVVLSEHRSPSLPLPQVVQRLVESKYAGGKKKNKKANYTQMKRAKKSLSPPKKQGRKTG